MTSVLRGERVLKMKGSSDRPQIIIIPPGLLKAATSSSMPLKIAKISPREPLSTPSLSSSPGPSSPLTDALNPVRKRANLDHLSTEEKLLRRKLKNRVAAQNARDKKRVKMDEMEDEIALLRKRNASLEQENLRLRELQSRLTPSSTFCLPLSPVSSSSEEEELSIITLETPSLPETNPSLPAERVNDLPQKGRVTTLAASLLLMMMTSLMGPISLSNSSKKRRRTLLPSRLPLDPPHPSSLPSWRRKTKRLHGSNKSKLSWRGPRLKSWRRKTWSHSSRVT
eukprot:TRINITY_DN2416_c0_g1_i1.p1 TRINITY_DN2416_c0_g1~~TRINITY_DN2416_c0_g1_i1.p1  ORF type:complete len:282 (-),score=83.87 TRINITY_DN2416_c0_g1_i1:266-1111(-)